MNEGADFLPEAGIDEIECPLEVDAEIGFARAPDSRDGGGVEDGVNTNTGIVDDAGVLNIAQNGLCAGDLDSRVEAAGEDADMMPALTELLDEVESEESAASGDEHLQLIWSCDHFLTKKNRIFLAGQKKVSK
jgi:hypothetical protein